MDVFEEFCEAFAPQGSTTAAGAFGRVTATAPLTVATQGLAFTGAALGVNPMLLEEDEDFPDRRLSAGNRVLCATLDGWQTIVVICKVV